MGAIAAGALDEGRRRSGVLPPAAADGARRDSTAPCTPYKTSPPPDIPSYQPSIHQPTRTNQSTNLEKEASGSSPLLEVRPSLSPRASRHGAAIPRAYRLRRMARHIRHLSSRSAPARWTEPARRRAAREANKKSPLRGRFPRVGARHIFGSPARASRECRWMRAVADLLRGDVRGRGRDTSVRHVAAKRKSLVDTVSPSEKPSFRAPRSRRVSRPLPPLGVTNTPGLTPDLFPIPSETPTYPT